MRLLSRCSTRVPRQSSGETMQVTALGRGFTAMGHRNYRLFWWGQLISLIGTWMQTTAQAWLVLQLTGSAADLGIVTALQSLPVLVIGFYGGVVADLMPKHKLLVITQIVQMLLAFALGALVATHTVQMWHIYLLATLLGISNAFDLPARQAFVMEMVGRDDLMNAVALSSMQFNAARVIGPAIAGISIALIGVTGSFLANGVSFIAVIAGLLMMRAAEFHEVEAMERMSVGKSLKQGCAYVIRTPTALLITVLVGVVGLFALNVTLLAPVFAQDVLHAGAAGYGGMMAAMGGGALVAALAAAYARKAGWPMIIGGTAIYLIFQVLFALSHVYVLSLVLLAIVGFGMVMMFTMANTAIQREVPNQLRGRVMGVYTAISSGTMPVGNLGCGFVAGAFGPATAMIGGAVAAAITVGGLGGWLFTHRRTPGYAMLDDEALDIAFDNAQIARGERALREAAAS
jgi:MFS family permease